MRPSRFGEPCGKAPSTASTIQFLAMKERQDRETPPSSAQPTTTSLDLDFFLGHIWKPLVCEHARDSPSITKGLPLRVAADPIGPGAWRDSAGAVAAAGSAVDLARDRRRTSTTRRLPSPVLGFFARWRPLRRPLLHDRPFWEVSDGQLVTRPFSIERVASQSHVSHHQPSAFPKRRHWDTNLPGFPPPQSTKYLAQRPHTQRYLAILQSSLHSTTAQLTAVLFYFIFAGSGSIGYP